MLMNENRMTIKRFVALLLTVAMLIGICPTTGYEAARADEPAVATPTDLDPVEEEPSGGGNTPTEGGGSQDANAAGAGNLADGNGNAGNNDDGDGNNDVVAPMMLGAANPAGGNDGDGEGNNAGDGNDDAVVRTAGGHSRPGGVFGRIRIAFGIIRKGASVLPLAFTGDFSGEALHVAVAVAKHDFAVFFPLGDGRPTCSEAFDTLFRLILPDTVLVEVVTRTTVRSRLVGLV